MSFVRPRELLSFVCLRALVSFVRPRGLVSCYKANPEIHFDENAETEHHAELQNTWLKDLLSPFPFSAWFIQMIDYSRISRSSWTSARC